MNTKRIFITTRLLILSILIGSLILSGCGSVQTTNAAIPPTQNPPSTLTPTATPNPYATWSTNFADVTDLSASGIIPYQTQATIDTSSVHSGGKSIKAYGVVGTPGTCLNINFAFAGLVGKDSVDLSDNTLSIEMYVPADSPIYSLTIDVFSGDRYVTVRTAHDNLYRGQWRTYTVDLKEDIALKTWRAYSFLTSPGVTDEQAVDIIKNAKSIAIIGGVWSSHPLAESYILIDRMGWKPAGPAPAYDPSVDSLQKYAPANLPIGGFIDQDGVTDPEYLQHFLQEFNTTIGWSGMPATEPAGDAFTFDESWNLTPFADYLNETYGLKLIRYAWGTNALSSMQPWLPQKSYAQAQTILENYMKALVSHYKGKTYIWLLFNELLQYHLPSNFTGFGLKDRTKTPQTWGDNYSPWSSSPSDLTMIEDAFRVARAADPNALLFIGEGYSAVEGHPGAEALYQMVSQMKRDGTPIDGVGFQCHIVLDKSGNFYEVDPAHESRLPFDPANGFTQIAANVERYQALGLNVAFNEVDVPIYLADIDITTAQGQALLAQRRQLQADAYRSLLHIALTHPNVVAFNTWSWADEYSWTETNWQSDIPQGFGNDTGLFDQLYQKKPSYEALLNGLKESTLPGWFAKVGPANASNDQTSNPVLQWSTTWNATSYEYCVDTSDNNACDASWVSAGTDTQASLKGLAADTTYYWQVRARNADGTTEADGSVWWSFKVSSAASQAPGSILFQDNFDGSLGEGWQWTNENKNYWSLTNTPGWLQITARKGNIGDNTGENLLLRPVPQGNFELETSVRFKPTRNFQAAGLVIYESPSHYLKFSHAFCDLVTCVGDGIYFDLITNGAPSGSNFPTPAPASGLVHLRLRREGNVFTAYMSEDGTTWTMIGEHQDDINPSAVGLVAGGTISTNPVPAGFDYFITYGLP